MDTNKLHAGALAIVLLTSFAPSAPSIANAASNAINPPMNRSGNKFEEAMKFTLKWEGGFADVAQDSGGKTYKGITAATAQAHGYNDPRNIPEAKIKEIYRKAYWDAAGCENLPSPLSSACFDTAVNFGLGGWDYFKGNLPADAVAAAKVVVERRQEYRHKRVREAPSQQVFLAGWLNRDKDLMQTISGGK